MPGQSLLRLATLLIHLATVVSILLYGSASWAVDVHVSPRFWYAIENLNTGQTDDIVSGYTL